MNYRIIDLPGVLSHPEAEDGFLTQADIDSLQTTLTDKYKTSKGEEKKAYKLLLQTLDGVKAEMITNGEEKIGLKGKNAIPGVRLFGTPRGYVFAGGQAPSENDVGFLETVQNPGECAQPTPRGTVNYVYTGSKTPAVAHEELSPGTEVVSVQTYDGAGQVCVTKEALEEMK